VSLLRGILRSTVYVRVQPNRFLVRHIQSGREVVADAAERLTTQRLLIGETEEHRVLMEAALAARSKRALVWLGHELGDDEVKEKAGVARSRRNIEEAS